MKKFFVAFMALATIAMVGCKKSDEGGNTPTPPPADPQEEIPQDIPTPAAGKMTFVVRVDKTYNEQICNTIGMIGGFCGYSADQAAIFEKVENTNTWYSVTLDAADQVGFGNSKLTVVAEDGTTSYDYEAVGGTYEILNGSDAYIELGDDYGTANCLKVIDGVDMSGKIVYVHVGSFKGNPCVAKESYTITLKMKYTGAEETVPAISGSMNSWGVTPMESAGENIWTVTFEGQASYEFKFQGSDGAWSNEILKYDADSLEWYKMGNFTLGEELSQTFDFSDETMYKWSYTPAPPAEPQIVTVSFKLPDIWTNTPTAWIWEDGKEGSAVDLTQDGDKWTYTTPSEVTGLNIIVRNGADWSGDANQTVDIRATESTCYELASDGASKATYTVVDCE